MGMYKNTKVDRQEEGRGRKVAVDCLKRRKQKLDDGEGPGVGCWHQGRSQEGRL